VHGCIRDSGTIAKLPNLGVKALGTHPLVRTHARARESARRPSRDGARAVADACVPPRLCVSVAVSPARCGRRTLRAPKKPTSPLSRYRRRRPPFPPLPPPPPPPPPRPLLAPQKSSKRDPGFRDVPVSFAGVTIRPGDWVYADEDGILVSPHELKL
jgi:hypothetical protein